ncbi:TetR/AcrR family transcriptional regulator [Curtobacterium flaccumfaciens]|uniref:TetR/AcrR family transcriptional regulator n=1 Tax=Curtobacterium flaccumfaciens TaxID=2035 RepID=UPI00136717B7|nr:TetR/AcrR family transcriptional regulator [Curtobacterium flaccumfaciens]MBT1665946.1 TetR/AcrR family transcriptional regulator [Curtobacterium flaccumfaciens pv. flaccumfaciens]QFS78791.2 TetR/AcrR family transcriptional regulator [Curtobacterium flaccumfaciens pv. flaccumfaciens]
MSDDASPTQRIPRAEVRERLLAAGAAVFAEQGVYGARLDDVAARAGFSKGAVYSNFSSKEDLLAQVMQRSTNVVLSSLQELVHADIAAVDVGDVLRAAFGQNDQSEQFALLSAFRGYAVRHPEFLPEFIRQRRILQDGVLELVRLWLGAHPEVEVGMTPEEFATVLIGANVGLVFDAPALPGVDPGELIATLVEAVIRRR